MSDALRAAKRHLDDLANNRVAAGEKPNAMHYGMLRTLVEDFERVVGNGHDAAPHCETCGAETKHGRFCSDRCRARWHREHDPRGVVRAVRRLKDGATSVNVHFAEPDGERALRLMLGASVVLGEVKQ